MLWYQADLPDEVELTFQEPVTPEGLSSLLEAEKQADAVVAARRFNILGLTLEERASDLLKGALEALGAHRAGETGDATTQVNLISDDQLEVTFGSEVETGDLSSILEALGYPGAEVVPRRPEGAHHYRALSGRYRQPGVETGPGGQAGRHRCLRDGGRRPGGYLRERADRGRPPVHSSRSTLLRCGGRSPRADPVRHTSAGAGRADGPALEGCPGGAGGDSDLSAHHK